MRNTIYLLIILLAGLAIFGACVKAPSDTGGTDVGVKKSDDGKVKIGFAMDTLKEERWQKDKADFESYCKQISVECVITVANSDAQKQANDVDNLLTQGVDVLVIAPHDATQAASMVDKAKSQGVPVISYDRLINSDKIDLYISHQVPVIGRKIAEYALEHVPTGNYVMVYGAPTDNNALIMQKEQEKVLEPAVKSGAVKIVASQNAQDWKADEALKIVENALTKTNDQVNAVVASNDGMAGGAISALETKGLAGKVLVTGQDAEKAALQRIAKGTQTMTVYKPIQPLAQGAVDSAVKLAKGEALQTTPFRNETLGKDVPSILLDVMVVDKNNLMDTVVKDGWISYDELYAGVPEDQRPKKPE
ncbi:MAG: substrate-binding domain-containing protein [Pyrinomonadaceae bacterium]